MVNLFPESLTCKSLNFTILAGFNAYIFFGNSAGMSDDAEYRCFVGGLSWSTSDKVLREEFDRFGGLVDAKVILRKLIFLLCSLLMFELIFSEFYMYTYFNV